MKSHLNVVSEATVADGVEMPSPCASCDVRHRAVCGSLNNGELTELSNHSRHKDVGTGDCMVFEGDELNAYYVVMNGAFKLYKLLSDGRRQITGFAFKGDFVGLPYQADYEVTVEALGASKLCQLPKETFEGLSVKAPPLGQRLVKLMATNLAASEDHMLLLGRKTAMERVASFLIWMSCRAQARGESASELDVPMSRTDMGDYLGLTVETVSRTFTKLRKVGAITLGERNRLTINDLEALQDLADGV
ncbi:MAG: helix-turn-helix domain-containing protein [Parvibaculaceae bacterium]|nr:helix-turn-helix domain-containing protein [Parvibaculaceae bacterium]